MFTVALIGGDGAGKTTVARNLQQDTPLPVKYLYMGYSMVSSNRLLLTSRFFRSLKPWGHKHIHRDNASRNPRRSDGGVKKKKGWPFRLWRSAQVLNRLLEASYRQCVSFYYQWRGFVVIYDRHFLIEAAVDARPSARKSLIHTLYFQILKRWYPKPDLVIFLDAPAEVLCRRKSESTIIKLNRQRDAIFHMASQIRDLRRVDATQPLDRVQAEVGEHVLQFYRSTVLQSGRKPLSSGTQRNHRV
jgi:thymidylate kinase